MCGRDPLFGLSESGFERLPTVKCKSIVHGPGRIWVRITSEFWNGHIAIAQKT